MSKSGIIDWLNKKYPRDCQQGSEVVPVKQLSAAELERIQANDRLAKLAWTSTIDIDLPTIDPVSLCYGVNQAAVDVFLKYLIDDYFEGLFQHFAEFYDLETQLLHQPTIDGQTAITKVTSLSPTLLDMLCGKTAYNSDVIPSQDWYNLTLAIAHAPFVSRHITDTSLATLISQIGNETMPTELGVEDLLESGPIGTHIYIILELCHSETDMLYMEVGFKVGLRGTANELNGLQERVENFAKQIMFLRFGRWFADQVADVVEKKIDNSVFSPELKICTSKFLSFGQQMYCLVNLIPKQPVEDFLEYFNFFATHLKDICFANNIGSSDCHERNKIWRQQILDIYTVVWSPLMYNIVSSSMPVVISTRVSRPIANEIQSIIQYIVTEFGYIVTIHFIGVVSKSWKRYHISSRIDEQSHVSIEIVTQAPWKNLIAYGLCSGYLLNDVIRDRFPEIYAMLEPKIKFNLLLCEDIELALDYLENLLTAGADTYDLIMTQFLQKCLDQCYYQPNCEVSQGWCDATMKYLTVVMHHTGVNPKLQHVDLESLSDGIKDQIFITSLLYAIKDCTAILLGIVPSFAVRDKVYNVYNNDIPKHLMHVVRRIIAPADTSDIDPRILQIADELRTPIIELTDYAKLVTNSAVHNLILIKLRNNRLMSTALETQLTEFNADLIHAFRSMQNSKYCSVNAVIDDASHHRSSVYSITMKVTQNKNCHESLILTHVSDPTKFTITKLDKDDLGFGSLSNLANHFSATMSKMIAVYNFDQRELPKSTIAWRIKLLDQHLELIQEYLCYEYTCGEYNIMSKALWKDLDIDMLKLIDIYRLSSEAIAQELAMPFANANVQSEYEWRSFIKGYVDHQFDLKDSYHDNMYDHFDPVPDEYKKFSSAYEFIENRMFYTNKLVSTLMQYTTNMFRSAQIETIVDQLASCHRDIFPVDNSNVKSTSYLLREQIIANVVTKLVQFWEFPYPFDHDRYMRCYCIGTLGVEQLTSLSERQLDLSKICLTDKLPMMYDILTIMKTAIDTLIENKIQLQHMKKTNLSNNINASNPLNQDDESDYYEDIEIEV